MISVVIPTFNAATTLPRMLSPLVQGVADGLVKQAIVADGGSTDETLAIAEGAGCDLVQTEHVRAAQCAAGAMAAKAPWLLFLEASTLLDDGWLDETRRFVERSKLAAAFTLGVENDGPGLVAARVRELAKRPTGAQGLLIHRALYDAVGGYTDEIVARIGPGRLVILRTKAFVIS